MPHCMNLVSPQELSVRNNVTGEQCVTVRRWVRVPTTISDLERLGRLLE